MKKGFWRAAVLSVVLGVNVGACDTARPVRPVNHSPVVLSLAAFPTTIGPGDSAIVMCYAMDADGDTVVYDWTSDCRLVKKGASNELTFYNALDRSLVVYPGACLVTPVDTGWVSCFVRDRKGGGAYAGVIHVIVQQ